MDGTAIIMRQKRMINGALGFEWDEIQEKHLVRLLTHRRAIAKELQYVTYDSDAGQLLMESIEFINHDIGLLLIL